MSEWKRAGVDEMKECVVCGNKFSAYRHRQKYCCKSCQYTDHYQKARRLVEIPCEQCGTLITIARADLLAKQKRGKPILCSIRKENDCLSLWRGSRVEFACDHCGVKFLDFRSNRKNYTYHFCSRKCQDESSAYILRGEAHYRFKDGATSLPYGLGWTLARQRARKRDNYTCRDCGITEKELGRKLDVHHLIPFRDLSDPVEAHKLTNLISFCSSCHHRIEARQIKEPEMLTYLREMVG